MKNYCFLYVLVSIILFAGCKSDNDCPDAISDKSFDQMVDQYLTVQSEIDCKIGHILEEFPTEVTRAENCTNGQALVQFIINCPPEEIERLYYSHLEECERERIYYDDEIIFNALAYVSSESEANSFYDFVDEYISVGGNNITLLSSAAQGKSLPVQNAMIKSACVIDNVFVGEGRQISSSMSYCIHQLEIELVESFLQDEVVDAIMGALEATPGVDLFATLVIAGCDFTQALKTAHSFELCCATHWT